jgi:hypothetical protein
MRARDARFMEPNGIQMPRRATEVPDRPVAGVVQRNEAACLYGKRDITADAVELEHAATSMGEFRLGVADHALLTVRGRSADAAPAPDVSV